ADGNGGKQKGEPDKEIDRSEKKQKADEAQERARHGLRHPVRRHGENDPRHEHQKEKYGDEKETRLAPPERKTEGAGGRIADQDEAVPGDSDNRPEEEACEFQNEDREELFFHIHEGTG